MESQRKNQKWDSNGVVANTEDRKCQLHSNVGTSTLHPKYPKYPCSHLTQGPDKVHNGVAVQLGGAGEDPVHGHHHALRTCFRQRFAAYAYAAYASYAAAACRLQRRHEDVAHEGGERGVGFRRSPAPAAVMIVMVMTLQQRVEYGTTLFGRDSAARTFL